MTVYRLNGLEAGAPEDLHDLIGDGWLWPIHSPVFLVNWDIADEHQVEWFINAAIESGILVEVGDGEA